MKRLLHGNWWLSYSPAANKFEMADPWMKLQDPQPSFDVAQHCSVFIFPLQKCLCCKFRNFLLRNKDLVYFTLSLIGWSELHYFNTVHKTALRKLTTLVESKNELKGWVVTATISAASDLLDILQTPVWSSFRLRTWSGLRGTFVLYFWLVTVSIRR